MNEFTTPTLGPGLARGVRHELPQLVRLALPVVVVQVGLMLMGVVDTMMLGRVSEAALAAGALGHAVSFGVLVLGMGLLFGLDPLVAQAHGASDRERVATLLVRGFAVACLLLLPAAGAQYWLAGHLELLGQKPEVAALARGYLVWLLPGILPFFLYTALRQSLQAMTIVWPAAWAALFANLVNALANWLLIFGGFGFPALGVAGAAIATTFSRLVMLLLLFWFCWPLLRPYLALPRRPALELRGLWQLVAIGAPIALQVGAEFYVFGLAALLMGMLGARELAAHQIALNLASLSFMVPLGVAGAATTRVGNAVGRGDAPAARRAAATALLVGSGVMLVFAAAFAFAPRFLARLYTNQPEVVTLAATLLPLAALFQVFDGTQVVGAGILRGIADTRFAAAIAFTGFWVVGLPVGAYLAFARGGGPVGLWWGLTLGIMAVAVLLVVRVSIRFRRALRAVASH